MAIRNICTLPAHWWETILAMTLKSDNLRQAQNTVYFDYSAGFVRCAAALGPILRSYHQSIYFLSCDSVKSWKAELRLCGSHV